MIKILPRFLKTSLLLVLFFCLLVCDAQANSLMPGLMLIERRFLFFLIPIVIIETLVLRKYMKHTSFIYCLESTFWSNLLSTLVGIPLIWAILWPLQQIVMAKALKSFGADVSVDMLYFLTYHNMLPKDLGHIYWIVPVSIMCLFVPFFFISVWTEAWVNKRFLKKEDPAVVKQSTYKANLASYGLLYAVSIWQLISFFQYISNRP